VSPARWRGVPLPSGPPALQRIHGPFPGQGGHPRGDRADGRLDKAPSALALDHPDSDREQQHLQRYGGSPIKGAITGCRWSPRRKVPRPFDTIRIKARVSLIRKGVLSQTDFQKAGSEKFHRCDIFAAKLKRKIFWRYSGKYDGATAFAGYQRCLRIANLPPGAVISDRLQGGSDQRGNAGEAAGSSGNLLTRR
jgi:hypothetical protein